MEKGNVRWFDAKKGYGFIAKESDGKDIFVHFSAITMEGYKTLRTHDLVEFEVMKGDKGPQASDVKVVGSDKPEGAEAEVSEVTA